MMNHVAHNMLARKPDSPELSDLEPFASDQGNAFTVRTKSDLVAATTGP
jgi:hypothetical protein